MAYKGSRRGFGEIYRYVLSDVCLCAKAYVLYADGANMWIMSSELGSVSRDMPRVPVCFSASFCGLNLRTVPQLSVKKFRVPLGYRRLVLGLKVGKPKRVCSFFGYFEWSTWRAHSTKRKSRRRLRHMQKLGAVLTYFGNRFQCLQFVVVLFV